MSVESRRLLVQSALHNWNSMDVCESVRIMLSAIYLTFKTLLNLPQLSSIPHFIVSTYILLAVLQF